MKRLLFIALLLLATPAATAQESAKAGTAAALEQAFPKAGLPALSKGQPFKPAPTKSVQYRMILIREARMIWGLDANVALFAAQIHQESMWNADAVSKAGARGLGQHMPATANELHTQSPKLLGGLPMYSALWSIRALLIYNQKLYGAIKPYGVEPLSACERTAMMLAAYNGGLGWINRDRRLAKSKGANPDIWFGGVDAWTTRAAWAKKENRHYPDVILNRHMPIYLNAMYPGADLCP